MPKNNSVNVSVPVKSNKVFWLALFAFFCAFVYILRSVLRLNEGIDKTRFAALSGLAWEDFAGRGQLAALKDEGLVEETPQNVRVTPAGRLLLNYVIEQICL